MAAQKGWIAKKWPQLGVDFIGINQKSPVVGGAKNLPLRQALSYSVDRNAVINTVSEGVPLVPNGVVPVGIPGSNLSTLPYPYDPAKAKQIVRQLGAVPPLKLWYNTGANLERDPRPGAGRLAGHRPQGDHDGLRVGHLPHEVLPGHAGPALSSGLVWPTIPRWTTSCIRSSRAASRAPTPSRSTPTRRSTSCSPRRAARLDQTQRLQIYAQAEKQILADAPVIPLYFCCDYRIMDTRVLGQQHDPMGGEDMNLVWVAQ